MLNPRPGAVIGKAAISATLAVLLVAAPALADDFNRSQCLNGTAAGADYAEYDEDFATGGWKEHSGVAIASESQVVILSVTDAYGNSICTNTADLTTSCKFKAGFSSTFTIRIDNGQNSTPANYQVCAF